MFPVPHIIQLVLVAGLLFRDEFICLVRVFGALLWVFSVKQAASPVMVLSPYTPIVVIAYFRIVNRKTLPKYGKLTVLIKLTNHQGL